MQHVIPKGKYNDVLNQLKAIPDLQVLEKQSDKERFSKDFFD